MEEVEGLQTKKKKLEAVVTDLMAFADGYAERKAKRTGDISHVVKSNSLRKTAKAKAEELDSIKTQIDKKLKDLL
ncbi:hypothetical protein HPB49_006724 [Dermacentor silvarum]|uniref:Uncharacterized protein n=1 Tax=Dermacentor silvarum TaxID=543639 RepID=A0ACB8DIF3_DERSI|nr:hypothetical protein HPB49_006724 [Dermacentor silvarum]